MPRHRAFYKVPIMGESERGIRTELKRSSERPHPGFGAGSGDTERYEYECPCGNGSVVEEYDNVPGFREHDVRLLCESCKDDGWDFVPGLPVRGWRLERNTPQDDRASRSSVGFTEEEVLSAVEELHSDGNRVVTPEMVIEHLSPGHLEASQHFDTDIPFGSMVNVLEKAGRTGQLPVVREGSAVKVVFDA